MNFLYRNETKWEREEKGWINEMKKMIYQNFPHFSIYPYIIEPLFTNGNLTDKRLFSPLFLFLIQKKSFFSNITSSNNNNQNSKPL